MYEKRRKYNTLNICIIFFSLISFILMFSVDKSYSKDRNLYIPITTGNYGSIVLRPNIKSLKTIRSKNIVNQKLDFSCGAAVTATILKYYLNIDVTEEKVINGLFKVGNLDKIIKRRGFSLLDIKKLVTALGFKAKGYKLKLEDLIKLNKPAIVAITIGKYKHYVIFKGVYKGRVFLADPAFGNTTLSVNDFKNMWYKNIALVIYPIRGKYNEKFETISAEEKIWVDNNDLRKAIYYRTYPLYNSFNEFR